MTRQLVERARHGDRDAFAALAERSLARLVGAAGLIVRDSSAAEDVAQEALVRAWRDLPSLRDPDRFDAWLHRLLVRASLDHLRRHRHELVIDPSNPIVELGAMAVENSVADRDELDRGLRRLPHAMRLVVVLRYYLQLSDGEIAAATGLPVGTVKSRMHRALNSLRAELAAASRVGIIEEHST